MTPEFKIALNTYCETTGGGTLDSGKLHVGWVKYYYSLNFKTLPVSSKQLLSVVIIIILISQQCSYLVDMFLHNLKQLRYIDSRTTTTRWVGSTEGDNLRLNTNCGNVAQCGFKTEI